MPINAEAIYRHPHTERKIDAPRDTKSGEVHILGSDYVGVVQGLNENVMMNGDLVSLLVRGVFEFNTTEAGPLAVGAALNWNDTTKLAQVAAGDSNLGVVAAALPAGSGTRRVRVSINE